MENKDDILESYFNKLKWLSRHIEQFVEYNGIYVHPKMLEVNKTTGEPYAADWIKLNADINKLCQEDAEFKQVYEYKLKQLDEGR